MSKIISLTAENVKRLQAIHIDPKGALVVVGGKNSQGKSSVLDSILYALGGDPDVKMPVRRGEEKAKIVLDLGDLVVRRTFTAGGGTSLIVCNADGVKQMSPQAILDKLTGSLTFDPLEFARQKPGMQAVTLRALVGLDFAAADAERQKAYDRRTEINREAKVLQSRLSGMVKHEGVGDAEKSVADVLALQTQASEKNQKNSETRRRFEFLKSCVADNERAVSVIKAQIQKLQSDLTEMEGQLNKNRAAMDAGKAHMEQLKDVDLEPFKAKAAAVESENAAIRANKAREEVRKQFLAKTEEAEKLTETIDRMDSDKRKTITNAKYPIDGLAFDTAGGVTLDGIPFEQCSSAGQLRVSVAIGAALNPKLRIMLIRDGSLLDEDSMKMLAEFAEKADQQIWIERVGVDAMTSVVIEDGNIKAEPEPAKE